MQATRDRTRLIPFLKRMVLLAGMAGADLSLSTPPSELQTLTVAFLYNFMKLSEWPADTMNGELTLCISEARDFGKELDAIADKPIRDKTLKVKRLRVGDDPHACQLLFLPREEKPIRMLEWIRTLGNAPVLTVSDMGGFLDQGGMIGLVSDGERLQFEIDLERIRQTHIKISSQMLKIAREVRGK